MPTAHKHIAASAVAEWIAQGQPIVIHEGYALNLATWIDHHPGGRLAILHMVGRDATDEINIYHSHKALLMMKKHRIGCVQQPWANLEPPIRHHDAHTTTKAPNALEADKGHAVPRHSRRRSVDPCFAAEILSKKLSGTATCTQRTSYTAAKDDSAHPHSAEADASGQPSTPDITLHRRRYAMAQESREQREGLCDNPAVDEATQRAITLDYRALHQQIKDQGLYQCRYQEYGKELLRYLFLFAVFLTLLHREWYLSSAVFLGLFWQQIMFTAHDAGHRGISGNFVIDTLIGAFVADFCCGLSIGWWKSSHNVHHLITNMPEHDPDLQNIPLFSTSPTYMKSITSTFYNFQFVWDSAADFLVPYQKYTYYPVMALARFNLYALSWLHLCSPRAAQLGAAWWTRPVELVFMVCYWILFGYWLVWMTLPNWPIRIAFVLISHIITMVLHVQITLSHWGMPTADLGPTESFPQRQLRTTMDVDCPAWMDWVHGGLQFQAVHHLFPRLPRHNLRQAQTLVRAFCDKTGLRYHCYGFVQGNRVVLSRLEEVALMVKMMVDCQRDMAQTGESGLY